MEVVMGQTNVWVQKGQSLWVVGCLWFACFVQVSDTRTPGVPGSTLGLELSSLI